MLRLIVGFLLLQLALGQQCYGLTTSVRLRASASTGAAIVTTMNPPGLVERIGSAQQNSGGFTWWNVKYIPTGQVGWAAMNWFTPASCGGGGNPPPVSPPPVTPPPRPPVTPPPRVNTGGNKFGVGLISPGNGGDFDLVKEMAGNNGWVLCVFPGVQKDSQGPDGSWVAALNDAWARGLNVAIRIGPNWGRMNVRDESDDGSHLGYGGLAAGYKRVIAGLPRPPPGKQLWIQVHNEPNLCYEWWCGTAGSPLRYEQAAREFTNYYIAVYDAIKSIGEPNYLVGFGAMAPGGTVQCGCCGREGCPGDQPGVLGLNFMDSMRAARGDVWWKMDFFASHAYPASNIGYGFNVNWPAARPGLEYYKQELAKIGRNIPVIITETGWATNRGDVMPRCSEEEKAAWTVEAYNNVWLPDNSVVGVMPFMFRDGYWGDQLGYGYVRTDGTRMPVFNSVKNLRQSRGL